ncbi:hypothetical protein HBH53_146260 [Parastagonospora nodorum]|nr:hypothetical protein HBH53_146260 [Parastagonospora nodorum]
MSSLLPALKFSLIERYSRSYVLCSRCVLLIYSPRPYLLYLNLSLYPPLDHSYSLQIAYAACRNCANLNPLSS